MVSSLAELRLANQKNLAVIYYHSHISGNLNGYFCDGDSARLYSAGYPRPVEIHNSRDIDFPFPKAVTVHPSYH